MLREQYNPDKAESLVHNIPTIENLLNIHINRLTEWDRWEDLVDKWEAFCEQPELYTGRISFVVDMVKQYWTERWGA